ncbi:sodium:solute symporter family protein [Paraglaciecola chathamensis]|jgi:SSS family solute:Na+ symporter|uniref:Pantothenate permease n=2 Tax=Paraglaciecola chathamensis TaxID=368405 RepID=A0A8H9IAP8_9ALTE|nr:MULTISPECIES: sodium:solute symporter family protein [Paraglaciecola]MBJ2135054.1 sodium:solute symporter family protein [Paraglaciecola chathamensis]GAC10900.1 Na+/solute symporter [Paraglaciecola chathamensis S18K6]GGZ66150.1 pantothenate permease [Paraglaciecola oceanifecundans]
MNISLIICVLAYELILILGVGYLVSRRIKKKALNNDAEFTHGGRQLGVSVIAATLALTVLGTPHIMGIFEMAWNMGATALWFSIAHVILLVIVCLSTGLWMRRTGVNSVPQLLEDLYNPAIRVIVGCVMAGSIFGVLTLETQGLAILLSAMTGWNVHYSAVAGGALGILYVVLAGIKEVGWINVANAVLMYISVILATLFIALQLPNGDFSSVTEYYVSSGNEQMLSIFGPPELMWTFAFGLVVALVFSQPANQPLLQVCMSAKNEKTIIKALWIAAPVNGMFGVFICVIGLTAKSIPEFEALGAKTAATTMLVELLPGWLVTLLVGSFMAAILSSFAMTALAPATIFSNDIYRRFYNPGASEKEIKKVTRIVIIILAIIAVAVGSFLPQILASVGWVLAWLMPVLWLLVSGLFWKRSNIGAGITLITVWVVNTLWSFTNMPHWLGMEELPNSYVMLTLTVLIGTLTNLLCPSRPKYFGSDEYKVKVLANTTTQ